MNYAPTQFESAVFSLLPVYQYSYFKLDCILICLKILIWLCHLLSGVQEELCLAFCLSVNFSAFVQFIDKLSLIQTTHISQCVVRMPLKIVGPPLHLYCYDHSTCISPSQTVLQSSHTFFDEFLLNICRYKRMSWIPWYLYECAMCKHTW